MKTIVYKINYNWFSFEGKEKFSTYYLKIAGVVAIFSNPSDSKKAIINFKNGDVITVNNVNMVFARKQVIESVVH